MNSCTVSTRILVLCRADAMGRPLHPLRFVMWMLSVSSMCLAIYLMTEGPLFQSKEKRTLSQAEGRQHLISALFGCYGTFVLGYIGMIPLGGILLNLAIEAGSVACFWYMLYIIHIMLYHVIHDQGGMPRARRVPCARPNYHRAATGELHQQRSSSI